MLNLSKISSSLIYHSTKVRCVALLCLVLFSVLSIAQTKKIDSLKKVLKNEKDDTNKVDVLNRISSLLENSDSHDSSISYAVLAQRLAEKINFKSGLSRAFVCTGNNYTDEGDYSKALEYMSKALKISQAIGDKIGITRATGNISNIYLNMGNCPKALEYATSALAVDEETGDTGRIGIQLGNIGNIYSAMGSFSKSLEYYFKALTISQKIGDKDGVGINLGNIANNYYTLLNYPKALEYFLKALSILQEIGDKAAVANNLGNIGNVYYDQGNKNKALEYYFKALALCEQTEDKDATAYNLSNIANVYCDQGDYAKALEYNFKGLAITREIGDKNTTGVLYTGLGRTYTRQKDYKKAKIILDSATTIFQNTSDKLDLQRVYSAKLILDSATGNYKTEVDDYRKYIAYRDSIINTESVKKITQLEVGYEFQKRDDSIKVIQEKTDIIKADEIKRKTITAYGLAIILILILISSVLLINRQQIKHRKDKIILEKELTNAKTMLDDYIQSLVEKNELLEQFKTDLEKLRNIETKETEEKRMEYLEHLNSATILTDEDWSKFRQLFEQVHKDFLKRLKDKLPDLTQAEIRLICLTKLNVGTKQMAGILGVSFDTIKKSRHRLRKKLGLLEEDSIDDIVNSI